jgi:hypothetical protein
MLGVEGLACEQDRAVFAAVMISPRVIWARPPYRRSQSTGQPMWARCKRIWWVRPVFGGLAPRRARGNGVRLDRRSGRRAPWDAWCGWPSFPAGRDGADRQVDQVAVVVGYATDDGGVLFLDRPLFELGGERQVRRIVLGDDDDSAGIAVQAMHDARPGAAADLAELFEAESQSGRQRAAPMPASRMDDHPGGLLTTIRTSSSYRTSSGISSGLVPCCGESGNRTEMRWPGRKRWAALTGRSSTVTYCLMTARRNWTRLYRGNRTARKRPIATRRLRRRPPA